MLNEYTYDEINIGHKEVFEVAIDTEMEDSFRRLTGDENPLHWDDRYASDMVGGGRRKI